MARSRRQRQNSVQKGSREATCKPTCAGDAVTCGLVGCYKIKLRTLGYRLVYQVRNDEMAVIVIAVDKRDPLAAYKAAVSRLSK